MTEAAYFVINALSLGSLYALMALGLVLVYGILKLVNFAYGELIMVAGYTLYLLDGSPLPWLVMALVAILAAVLALRADRADRLPAGAREVPDRDADHLVRGQHAVPERRAAADLAARRASCRCRTCSQRTSRSAAS